MSPQPIALEQRAELIKLGHVLGVPEARLEFLAGLEPAVLHELRDAAQHWLLEGHDRLFRNLAAASRLLPAALLVRIGEHAFGPMLVARIAGAMETARAVDVATRMSAPFLADVCRYLDPDRARAILRTMPAAAVREVALELLRRGEYVIMGRFIDSLSREALRVTIAAIDDEATLLRVGFFVESKRSLGDVIDLLDDARLRTLVYAAQAQSGALWREALTLMLHVDAPRRARFVDLMAAQSAEWIGELVAITQRLELWPALLPVLADARPETQRRLLGLPAAAQDDVQRALREAVRELDAPERFLDLVDALPESHRRAVRAELEKRVGENP